MQLRNKKTGEIGTPRIAYQEIYIDTENKMTYRYKSLQGVFEEWETYEEDKRYWYIDFDGEIMSKEMAWFNQAQDNIGNRFDTREEAEKVVEKLKAVKRLKDKGFRFDDWKNDSKKYLGDFVIFAHVKDLTDIIEDLDLLFGSEND